MIPDSIKIDENGDFEIEKTIYGYDYDDHGIKISIDFTSEEIEEAYLLAKSKRPVKYGCHINFDQSDDILDSCAMDFDNIFCSVAVRLQMSGKCKTDCQYCGDLLR